MSLRVMRSVYGKTRELYGADRFRGFRDRYIRLMLKVSPACRAAVHSRSLVSIQDPRGDQRGQRTEEMTGQQLYW